MGNFTKCRRELAWGGKKSGEKQGQREGQTPMGRLEFKVQKAMGMTSLVVQWLSIRLATQGTLVQSLVWEDLTCREAAKPVYHNY